MPAAAYEILASSPVDQPVLVLLRHAAREVIPEGSVGNDMPITGEGASEAEALGSMLGDRLQSLSTSPLLRCVQTAEALRRGAGEDLEIHRSSLLGDPGAFVADGELAWGNWQRLGHEGVLSHLATGGAALPGMIDGQVGTAVLLEFMRERADGLAGYHLFVTHDSLLLPVLVCVEGAELPAAEWPGFLDGFWVT